jgi:hypothetical protein
MSVLLRLLHFIRDSRQSSRLIQSVLLAFVLGLGAAAAAPAIAAANLSPDQQIICLGTGGMKVISFAADGAASEAQTVHASDCTMCGALQATLPAGHIQQGLQATLFDKPIPTRLAAHTIFESRAPPARAPPSI